VSRKKHGGHDGGEERWLLTYSDLITLLLAFFIILYSTSKADLEKFGKIAKSFQATFGVMGIDSGGGGLLGANGGIFDFAQLTGQQRQFMYISEKLQTYASQQGLGDKVAVNLRTEGIAITLSNGLLFPSGGVEMSDESRSTLAKIAELIRPIPNELRIEAHTDAIPTNSPIYPTNWELSSARAAVVARYLTDSEGIEAKRLSVLGYGEQRPLVPNDTREHRATNRRADIVVLYPSKNPGQQIDVLKGTNQAAPSAAAGAEAAVAKTTSGEGTH
jgi:chemotaxis protein MotB